MPRDYTQHPLCSSLYNLSQEDMFKNCILVFGSGPPGKYSTSLLCMISPFLKDKLCRGDSKTLVFPEADKAAFDFVLALACGRDIQCDNLLPLFLLAQHLRMEDVQLALQQAILESVTVQTCCSWLQYLEDHPNTTLRDVDAKAYKIALANFAHLVTSVLSTDVLQRLVQDDYLAVQSEEEVLQTILLLAPNVQAQLLPHVRWGLLQQHVSPEQRAYMQTCTKPYTIRKGMDIAWNANTLSVLQPMRGLTTLCAGPHSIFGGFVDGTVREFDVRGNELRRMTPIDPLADVRTPGHVSCIQLRGDEVVCLDGHYDIRVFSDQNVELARHEQRVGRNQFVIWHEYYIRSGFGTVDVCLRTELCSRQSFFANAMVVWKNELICASDDKIVTFQLTPNGQLTPDKQLTTEMKVRWSDLAICNQRLFAVNNVVSITAWRVGTWEPLIEVSLVNPSHGQFQLTNCLCKLAVSGSKLLCGGSHCDTPQLFDGKPGLLAVLDMETMQLEHVFHFAHDNIEALVSTPCGAVWALYGHDRVLQWHR